MRMSIVPAGTNPEQQLALFADRTSSARLRANQLRYWATLAYLLSNSVTGWRHPAGQCALRLRVLKIGAHIRVTGVLGLSELAPDAICSSWPLSVCAVRPDRWPGGGIRSRAGEHGILLGGVCLPGRFWRRAHIVARVRNRWRPT